MKRFVLYVCVIVLLASQGFTQEQDDPRLIELQTEYQRLVEQKKIHQNQIIDIDRQLLRVEGRFNERIRIIEPEEEGNLGAT